MPESTPHPQDADVPDELVDLAWRAELARRSPGASAEKIEEYCDFEAHPSMASQREELRPIVAALLPATYRYWFAQAFGTREEIEAREAEARDRLVDDPADLCERLHPGHHARLIREQVAAEIRDLARRWSANAQKSTTLAERERRLAVAGALTDAADHIERGEP